MVPQSDSPPKPLGATVPHSSLCRWNWAQKLKPLPLHSSEALDAYFWVRGFLGVDQHDHQKKSKILENRLNRLAGYENPMVLILWNIWIYFYKNSRNWDSTNTLKFCKYFQNQELRELTQNDLRCLKIGFKNGNRFFIQTSGYSMNPNLRFMKHG